MRLVAVGACVAIGLTIALASGGNSIQAKRPGHIAFLAAGKTVARVDLRPFVRDGRLDPGAIRAAAIRAVPRSLWVQRGHARIRYALDRTAAEAAAGRVRIGGGSVAAPASPVEAAIGAPVVRQKLHNDCESAALEIVLAVVGHRVDQLRLQRELPRSGPLDPVGSGPDRVWGDPDAGFVGRPDGGGAAGGFGVYQRPVAAVARRHGVQMEDLTGRAPATIYARLLSGRPVLAWVGLSAGSYDQWRSPNGRPITVNYGEHAIALVGVASDGSVAVVNPLTGARETWSRERFESASRLLGRRALAAP
jgi:uncharacterized protein YvpB